MKQCSKCLEPAEFLRNDVCFKCLEPAPPEVTEEFPDIIDLSEPDTEQPAPGTEKTLLLYEIYCPLCKNRLNRKEVVEGIIHCGKCNTKFRMHPAGFEIVEGQGPTIFVQDFLFDNDQGLANFLGSCPHYIDKIIFMGYEMKQQRFKIIGRMRQNAT